MCHVKTNLVACFLLAVSGRGLCLRWWQFQLVSLKQIALFLLLQTPLYRGMEALDIFVPGELLQQPLGFVKPTVVYASPNNPGARQLAAELEVAYSGISITEEPPAWLP